MNTVLRTAVLVSLTAATPLAQTLTVQLVDGRTQSGRVVGWDKDKLVLNLVAGRVELAHSDILFFHGEAAARTGVAPTVIHLTDGSRVFGKIVGTDPGQDKYKVESEVHGLLSVSLDNTQRILVAKDGRFPTVGIVTRPAGSDTFDVLFRRVEHGLDPVLGSIAEIVAQGVRFEPRDQENKAKLHIWDEIGALVLERPRPTRVPIAVMTRDGSLLHGTPTEVTKNVLTLATLIGPVRVPIADILAGHVEDDSTRKFLSDMEPTKVEETSFFDQGSTKLWRYQRDRNVLGGPMAVAGRYYTKGLGCHSYSRPRLSFVVPAGMSRFRAWIGVDDCAAKLTVAGNLDFKISVDGVEKLAVTGVRGGIAAKALEALPVQPGQTVTLELAPGEDLFLGDRGDWLYPVFLK